VRNLRERDRLGDPDVDGRIILRSMLRKLATMQWIQDPNQSNIDNLNNVRHHGSGHFRNKKKAYLRAKVEELETNSKINNIRDLYRGINDFKKGYQHRTNIRVVNNEKGDLVARVIKSRKLRLARHLARMGRREACVGFWWRNLRERDHWGDPGVDGRIILGLIIRKWDLGVRTELGGSE
jgi:hypothetical protein